MFVAEKNEKNNVTQTDNDQHQRSKENKTKHTKPNQNNTEEKWYNNFHLLCHYMPSSLSFQHISCARHVVCDVVIDFVYNIFVRDRE